MDRLNSMGIRRRDLKLALRNPRTVADARRIDSCILCRRNHVNEAGLCDVCYGSLDDPEELELAQAWTRGGRP